jgi:membrane fusion protein (multidrug efflux system)
MIYTKADHSPAHMPSMNKFVAIIFICFISLFTACSSKKTETSTTSKSASGRPKNIIADGYVVKAAPYAASYTASGNLLPNESIEVHPEESGRVTGIFFREGAVVRKGQLLITLNDADIKAQIGKLQAQRSLQQSTQRRQAELLRIGGISKQDYEATQTNVQGVNADIAVAQATLRKLKILAPFDGKIGLRGVSVGAIVSPTTVVANLQQISPLKMDFTIPDQYKNQLALGETVRFYVDGLNDTLSGKIAAVEPGADPTTHTIKARAIVPNSDGRLTAGSFAHVMLAFKGNPNTILVPAQSIIPTTRDKKVAVLKNGKAVIQTVTLGVRTADRVEIVQGLNPGDTILTTALMQVKQGMDVKIKKVN